MQKTLVFLISFIGAFYSSSAQNIWQKKVPGSPFNVSFVQLSYEDGQYLIGSNKAFVSMDRIGSVTGFININIPQVAFPTSIIKIQSTATGHPYFLLAGRISPSAPNYALLDYRPGVGVVNEKIIVDTTGAFSGKRPQIVELDDSTFVVFGLKYFRKIKYSESTGFTEEWVRLLNVPVEAAFFHNNMYFVAGSNGTVAAFDDAGNTIWTKNSSTFSYHSLKPVADGFVGCGHTTNGKAAIAKLNTAGMTLWEKETGDKDYHDIIETSDGFVLTGESGVSTAMIALMDANGNEVWKQEYGPGAGAKILQDTDGGFVMAARTAPSAGLKLLKTDNQGFTSPVEDAYINNRRIETTSVQATLDPWSSLFFDASDATFISIPDSAATILSFAPWIGGLDENESLHIAAAEYNAGGNSDYATGLANSKKRELNRVWKATREEINRLRLDFGTDQTLDQPVPFDLLTWPAKGNPNLRYNLDFTPVETDPDIFPAPFKDANGDGIYNVYDGDYPYLKGDQMVWWMLTDSILHQESKGSALGVDLLISVYAYDCPQTGSVDNTLFTDFEIINRSANNYHNTFTGFFTDFDLGCFIDDNIGTIPDANTFYVYNEDELDEECGWGIHGFGEKIPVQTVTFLNKSLDHSLFFNNAAVGIPPPGTVDPDSPAEFYSLLQGRWKDGTPLTVGGSGYNPGSTDYTNHIFPDNPSDLQGWSMCTEDLPYADRRMISSHGPFDFAAGDTFHIQIAFTLHPDIPHPCPDIFGLVKPVVTQISQWKNDGALDAAVDLGQVVDLPPGQSVVLNPGAVVPGATYLWSTGESTPVIIVTTPGEYSVTVSPGTGCQIVDNVLVQMGTSEKQPSNMPDWKVRPNPAVDFVYVECPDCAAGDLKVVMRNAQGVAVLTSRSQNLPLRLETGNLAVGMYWLELWQDGQFWGSRKLVLLR